MPSLGVMSTIAERVRDRFAGEPGVPERVASRFVMQRTAGTRWDGKVVGKDCRLQWTRYTWHLEELPQKGKRKLRVSEMQNPFGLLGGGSLRASDHLIPENILQDAKPSTGDSYEAIKKKIEGAMEEAADKLLADPEAKSSKKDFDWVKKAIQWYENEVYFLEVIPEDVHPFKAEGKDFVVDVAWGDFKSYSPSSDLQQTEPHYALLKQKSPGAARKLYNTLKTEPNALKSVPWNDFAKWLDTKKIGYEWQHSVWH